MTVASTTNRADLTITSGTTSYPYAFRIFADGDLVVVRRHPTTGAETTLVLNTDYTVTGAGNANGGTIVISSGNATTYNGYGLTIRRVLATTQSTSIRNQGAFYPEVHEDVFDRLAMVDQQQQEEIDRSVKLPATVAASAFDPTLPAGVTAGAGRTLLVNATGNGFDMGPTATEISSAQAAATSALAALDSFDDRYLGAKSSDPTLDNDGNALLTGALYWNTTTNAMRVYSGTKWTEFSSVAYVPATYSGDGVTVAFTLPVAPVSKNNVFVSIGGVNQHKSEFSVSGTSLTFVTAPALGASNIECIVAQPLPVASADAANVNYLSGSGGSQRTVANELDDLAINIKRYGAIGDGSTDNQSVIASASAAAKLQGKSLYVPDGVFCHSGMLTFDSITVYGPGTLKSTDATSSNPQHAIMLTGTAPKLRGVTLATTWPGSRQSNDESSAVYVTNASRFEVSGCEILGSASAGIFVNNSSYGRVFGNYIENTLADGIHNVNGTNNVLIDNNRLKQTGDDAIAVVGYKTSAQPGDIIISNNKAYASGARGLSCVGGYGVQFIGNNIERSTAAGIYVASESAYNTHGVNNVIVSNNRLKDCNTSSTIVNGAICLSGYASNPVQATMVRGNTISYTGAVTCYGNGILADTAYVERPVIDGNMIFDAKRSGIEVNCTSPEVTGNTIKSATLDGVLVNTSTVGIVRVVCNKIEDAATAGATSHGHINVENATGLTRCIMNGNDFIDGATSPSSIRFIPARDKRISIGNTKNAIRLSDYNQIDKVGTDWTITVPSSEGSSLQIDNLRVVAGETLKIVLQGKRHALATARIKFVRFLDQNQYVAIDQTWKYLASGPTGVAGTDYVALSGAVYYQRSNNITSVSNGTVVTTTMSADASDNVTITFTPAADMAVFGALEFAYKAG